MDTQTTINALFGIVSFLSGFLLKATWDALKELRVDMATLRQSIADNYVRRDDFREHSDRVMNLLDKIYEKLDGKEDKH
jgi:hypothetical protein